MVEFILNNLPIVLFIVITIVIRVLQVRFRARQKEDPQSFTSGSEPDEDDSEVTFRHELDDDEAEVSYRPRPDEAAALIDYARTRGASTHAVEKARLLQERLVEDQSRFEALPGLSADSLVPASLPPVFPPSPGEKGQAFAPAPEKQKSPHGFPYKPGNLSPLQQAMLWAEILGKPKGMA
jgi:hypothetical protein